MLLQEHILWVSSVVFVFHSSQAEYNHSLYYKYSYYYDIHCTININTVVTLEAYAHAVLGVNFHQNQWNLEI